MGDCPLCKSSRNSDFPIYYDFNGKRFVARQCRDCRFIYLLPRPSAEDLQIMYSDEYFLHDGTDCGAHASTDYETAAIRGSVKFPEILSWVKKFKPHGRFFEVGCGMGYFLKYARQEGYEVEGIEYAGLGARACREKFGLDVQKASFEDFQPIDETYDVVFMGDVLEHLASPLEMLRKAKRMLRPTGIVAVEVPSMFNSVVGRLATAGLRSLGKKKKMPMPPYHLNEFTPSTLRAMLRRAGFSRAVIVQRIKKPDTLTLRGNIFEKTTKKTLQYPNYVVTKLFRILGDRLLGIGIK